MKAAKSKGIKPQSIIVLKHGGMYIGGVIILFVLIGFLTTLNPAYRLSSHTLEKWTREIESTTYLSLLGFENKLLRDALPQSEEMPNLSATLFQLITNMRPDDPRSLIGQEIPGMATFENKIVVAGEGTSYADLSFESSPPLEDVLKERKAIFEAIDRQQGHDQPSSETTGDRNVVFIYNTHNRESFLPHLPDVTDPDSAHHAEVNVTMVSERLAEGLDVRGIGSIVDKTDHMSTLNERGWTYGRSYDASRQVVETAVSGNQDIEYVIDIHRDSLPREKTTIDIDGQSYAQLLFVVGKEHPEYEKNVSLARKLHNLIESRHPGLSKAVITKEGPGVDGIYNQDVSDRSLLLEFGGVGNTLDELYRTADIVADVFSDFYWDAEKVSGEGSES
ncbi:stage II sporulation protein P [Lentibacillus saliphilus]|uniref:stage II sporulation protein P n=1 Tax=Lentibacillus saliphilus TaxID=2737028 RepID=UPI001C2FA61C|nr:stage II sporulation protein P [Lentibacillus saliphilus]